MTVKRKDSKLHDKFIKLIYECHFQSMYTKKSSSTSCMFELRSSHNPVRQSVDYIYTWTLDGCSPFRSDEKPTIGQGGYSESQLSLCGCFINQSIFVIHVSALHRGTQAPSSSVIRYKFRIYANKIKLLTFFQIFNFFQRTERNTRNPGFFFFDETQNSLTTNEEKREKVTLELLIIYILPANLGRCARGSCLLPRRASSEEEGDEKNNAVYHSQSVIVK